MASDRRPRILVLEDEWVIAASIETALGDAGFDVLGPVGRVAEASALLQREQCDGAILDVNLHGQFSFGIAETLAEAGTPFLFMSGYTDADLPAHLRDSPLMAKPVGMEALCQRIGALVRGPIRPPE